MPFQSSPRQTAGEPNVARYTRRVEYRLLPDTCRPSVARRRGELPGPSCERVTSALRRRRHRRRSPAVLRRARRAERRSYSHDSGRSVAGQPAARHRRLTGDDVIRFSCDERSARAAAAAASAAAAAADVVAAAVVLAVRSVGRRDDDGRTRGRHEATQRLPTAARVLTTDRRTDVATDARIYRLRNEMN